MQYSRSLVNYDEKKYKYLCKCIKMKLNGEKSRLMVEIEQKSWYIIDTV